MQIKDSSKTKAVIQITDEATARQSGPGFPGSTDRQTRGDTGEEKSGKVGGEGLITITRNRVSTEDHQRISIIF